MNDETNDTADNPTGNRELPELDECGCDPCKSKALEPHDYCLECLESGCRIWDPRCQSVAGVSV